MTEYCPPKSPNQLAIEAFAAKFDPPLPVVQTRNIGGNQVHDGWMCALYVPESEIGLTATAWGKGYFKTWIEITGLARDSERMADIAREMLTLATGRQGSFPATPPLASAASAATGSQSQDLRPSTATPQPDYHVDDDGNTHATIDLAKSKSPGLCEHDFQEPRAGARKRCWKCGLQEPKAPQVDEAPKAE